MLSADRQRLGLTDPQFRVITLQYFSDKFFHFFCMHGIGPAGFLKCIDFLYHQRSRHFFKTRELVTFSVCKCKASVCSGLFFLWQGLIILRLYEWTWFALSERVTFALNIYRSSRGENVSHQSKHNLCFPSGTLAASFGVINPQATNVIYIYIYMEYPFLMFLNHTQRRSTVGRTPLDE